MDPVTCIAAASAAYKGIKKAVDFGKSVHEMSGTISQFAKAASDLDFLEKKSQKPPLYKMFSDNEANALEIWSKKQQLAEYREDLRSHISWHYGPSAWEAIVKIEGQQRKRQQEMVYKKQEFIDKCINLAIGTALLLAGFGSLIAILFFLGVKHGKF